MKISTKGRYGIRFLTDIANQSPGEHTTLAEISNRQQISAAYLGQIAVVLKRAGYIRSIKGSGGGFLLAKPASEIRISDVLRDLEGDLTIVDPPLPSDNETPYRSAIRIGLYQKIDRAIENVLGELTLDKLSPNAGKQGYMYYI